jgi:hypothetical protein
MTCLIASAFHRFRDLLPESHTPTGCALTPFSHTSGPLFLLVPCPLPSALCHALPLALRFFSGLLRPAFCFRFDALPPTKKPSRLRLGGTQPVTAHTPSYHNGSGTPLAVRLEWHAAPGVAVERHGAFVAAAGYGSGGDGARGGPVARFLRGDRGARRLMR